MAVPAPQIVDLSKYVTTGRMGERPHISCFISRASKVNIPEP